jgi:hypothetical protein
MDDSGPTSGRPRLATDCPEERHTDHQRQDLGEPGGLRLLRSRNVVHTVWVLSWTDPIDEKGERGVDLRTINTVDRAYLRMRWFTGNPVRGTTSRAAHRGPYRNERRPFHPHCPSLATQAFA